MSRKLRECNKQKLWQGCVFGGIVNAVKTAEKPLVSSFRWWNDRKYILSNPLSVQEGVVKFEHGWHSANGWAVGIFYDSGSSAGPLRNNDYSLSAILHELPNILRPVVLEVIDSHFLKHKTDNNQEVAYVTCVIWSADDDNIESSDYWNDLMAKGMSAVETEMMGADESALAKCRDNYSMSSDQLAIAIRLFNMRLDQPDGDIILDDEMIRHLEQHSSNQESLDKCEGLLDAMGFLFGPAASPLETQ